MREKLKLINLIVNHAQFNYHEKVLSTSKPFKNPFNLDESGLTIINML